MSIYEQVSLKMVVEQPANRTARLSRADMVRSESSSFIDKDNQIYPVEHQDWAPEMQHFNRLSSPNSPLLSNEVAQGPYLEKSTYQQGSSLPEVSAESFFAPFDGLEIEDLWDIMIRPNGLDFNTATY